MINFFLSSTFKDMQQERDVIKKKVIPFLDYYSLSQGQRCTLTDLRWGIRTDGMNDDQAKCRILDKCLDYIDECEPFFIVLLGDNYGTTLKEEFIDIYMNSSSKASRFNGKKERLRNQSITSIEIRHYLDLMSELESDAKIIICIRSIEGCSGREDDRLSNLKKELREEYKDWIVDYTVSVDANGDYIGLDRFADALIEKIKKRIEPYYTDFSSDFERRYQFQQEKIKLWKTKYKLNPESVDKIVASASERSLLRVYGSDDDLMDAAIAKLSEISSLSLVYVEDRENQFPDRSMMAGYLLYQAKDNHTLVEKNIAKVSEADLLIGYIRRNLGEGKEVWLIIDERKSNINFFNLIPAIDDDRYHCVVFFNCGTGDLCVNFASDDPAMLYSRFIALFDNLGKELSDDACNNLVSKCIGKSYEYVSLLVRRVNMADRRVFEKRSAGSWNENWNRYISELVNALPGDEVGLKRQIISDVAKDVSKDNTGFSMDRLFSIASVESGMQAEDYAKMMGISLVDFYAITSVLDFCFTTDSEGFISCIYAKQAEDWEIKKEIIEYLDGCGPESLSKSRLFFPLLYDLFEKNDGDNKTQYSILEKCALYLANIYDKREYFENIIIFFNRHRKRENGWFWIRLIENAYTTLSTHEYYRSIRLFDSESITKLNTIIQSHSFPRAFWDKVIACSAKADDEIAKDDNIDTRLYQVTLKMNRLKSSSNPTAIQNNLYKKYLDELDCLLTMLEAKPDMIASDPKLIRNLYDWAANLSINDNDLGIETRITNALKYRRKLVDLLHMCDPASEKELLIERLKYSVYVNQWQEELDMYLRGMIDEYYFDDILVDEIDIIDKHIVYWENHQYSAEGKDYLAISYYARSFAERDYRKKCESLLKAKWQYEKLYEYNDIKSHAIDNCIKSVGKRIIKIAADTDARMIMSVITIPEFAKKAICEGVQAVFDGDFYDVVLGDESIAKVLDRTGEPLPLQYEDVKGDFDDLIYERSIFRVLGDTQLTDLEITGKEYLSLRYDLTESDAEKILKKALDQMSRINIYDEMSEYILSVYLYHVNIHLEEEDFGAIIELSEIIKDIILDATLPLEKRFYDVVYRLRNTKQSRNIIHIDKILFFLNCIIDDFAGINCDERDLVASRAMLHDIQ